MHIYMYSRYMCVTIYTIYKYVCVHIFINVCVRIYMCIYIFICVCIYLYKCVYTYMHIYLYMCVCVCIFFLNVNFLNLFFFFYLCVSTGSQKQPEWSSCPAGDPQRKGQQLLCWLRFSKSVPELSSSICVLLGLGYHFNFDICVFFKKIFLRSFILRLMNELHLSNITSTCVCVCVQYVWLYSRSMDETEDSCFCSL